MAETDEAEVAQDPEVAEEELDSEQQALLHLGKIIEARRALPWEQWTFREKASFYMDRIFIGFLVISVLLLLGEFAYKMWYVTNVKKIAMFVSDSLIYLFNWLTTQEKQEELFEL